MVRWAGAAFIMTGIAGAACVKWSRSQFASVIVLAADRVAFAMVFKFVSVAAMAFAGKAFVCNICKQAELGMVRHAVFLLSSLYNVLGRVWQSCWHYSGCLKPGPKNKRTVRT